MKRVIGILVVGLMVAPAMGAQTISYSWEDGVGTILGSTGNVANPTNVTGAQGGSSGEGTYTCPGASEGSRYLHVAESPHSSTPKPYLAWITGLVDGDEISTKYDVYDDSVGLSPSYRVWGYYTSDTDIAVSKGSAGGNGTYSAGTGWETMSHSWTFSSNAGARSAMRVEVSLYSYPSTSSGATTDFFVDHIRVTAPDGATITLAPEPASLLLLALGGVALLRRR